jgi:hypothetical protein
VNVHLLDFLSQQENFHIKNDHHPNACHASRRLLRAVMRLLYMQGGPAMRRDDAGAPRDCPNLPQFPDVSRQSIALRRLARCTVEWLRAQNSKRP